jgi:hypothetical protein
MADRTMHRQAVPIEVKILNSLTDFIYIGES